MQHGALTISFPDISCNYFTPAILNEAYYLFVFFLVFRSGNVSGFYERGTEFCTWQAI